MNKVGIGLIGLCAVGQATAASAVWTDGIAYVADLKKGECEVVSAYRNIVSVRLPERLRFRTAEGTEVVCRLVGIGDKAFAGCAELSRVELPPSVKRIGRMAFAYCPIQHVKLPDSVELIEEKAFYFCAIKRFECGDGIRKVGDGALGNCSGLEEVVLNDRIEWLGEGVFLNCKRLKELNFPQSVRHVGKTALKGCVGLSRISMGTAWDDETSVSGLTGKVEIERRGAEE